MSSAARSLFFFGIYVTLAGLVFLLAPRTVGSLLRLPAVSDGWFRVVGLLSLVIGAYDLTGGWNGLMPYIRASVWVRFGFAAGLGVLVALGQMPVTLLLFSATDLAGAAWTATALRNAPAPLVTAHSKTPCA